MSAARIVSDVSLSADDPTDIVNDLFRGSPINMSDSRLTVVSSVVLLPLASVMAGVRTSSVSSVGGVSSAFFLFVYSPFSVRS
jgi:hypothetical protein